MRVCERTLQAGSLLERLNYSVCEGTLIVISDVYDLSMDGQKVSHEVWTIHSDMPVTPSQVQRWFEQGAL